jgi:hypothetical protein
MLITGPATLGEDCSSSTCVSAPPSSRPASQTPAEGAASQAKVDSPQPKPEVSEDADRHGKRILWIIPNFKAVNADVKLPPLSVKEKFWLATQDSVDYSAFIYVGMFAGIAMASKSEPSFGQGASGYGIYYAHTYADNFIENFMVEAMVPSVTKQDPRYYTLGRGGFFKRSGYALSRLVVTRTDSGGRTFNVSEIVGAGAASGISNAYYPPGNTWVKTYQRWGSQIAQDGLSYFVKEFWPDVDRAVFHNKY